MWVQVLTDAARLERDNPREQLNGKDLVPVINSVAAMLTGYAIECALKGLWVRAGEKIIDANGEFVRVPNAGDHALGALARSVSKDVDLGALSAEDFEVLDRLSAFVVFAGRYPIPKKSEHMAAVKHSAALRSCPTCLPSRTRRSPTHSLIGLRRR
jgi:hypothetical protein